MRWLLYILSFVAVLAVAYNIVTYEPEVVYINQDVHFKGSFFTENHGDSARTEYEQKGDTIIQHYILLRESATLADEGIYDSKYLVRYYKNDTTLQGPYYTFEEQGYEFMYNKKDLLALCNKKSLSSDSLMFRDIRNMVEPVEEKQHNGPKLPVDWKKLLGNRPMPVKSPFLLTGGVLLPGYELNTAFAFMLLQYLPCKFRKKGSQEYPATLIAQTYANGFYGVNYLAVYTPYRIDTINMNTGAMM